MIAKKDITWLVNELKESKGYLLNMYSSGSFDDKYPKETISQRRQELITDLDKIAEIKQQLKTI